MKYFAYCCKHGFDLFKTLDEARANAQERVEAFEYENDIDGINTVCMGQVLETPQPVTTHQMKSTD